MGTLNGMAPVPISRSVVTDLNQLVSLKNVYMCMSACMSLSLQNFKKLPVSVYVCLSVFMYVCLSLFEYVCLSVFVYVYLSVFEYVCLSVSVYVCLSVFLYVCLYVCLSVFVYVCLSVSVYVLPVCLYVCQSLCMCACRSLCMSVFLCLLMIIHVEISAFVVLGVTQEMIDDIRLSSENKMLSELKQLHENGGDLDHAGSNGETPVRKCLIIPVRAVKSCQKTHPGNRSRQHRLTVYT